MRPLAFFVVVLLALSSLLYAGAVPRAVLPPPRLHLHRGTFDAQQPAHAALGPALDATASGPYAIIQLRGPIAPADRAALERTGVELLEYLPDYAYLVRGDPAQLAAAVRLPQVYARVPFTIADKLAPSLLRALVRGDTRLGPLSIIAWPGAEGALRRDLRGLRLAAAAPADRRALLQVAGLESVRWIEPLDHPRLLNDVARSIMHVDASAWQRYGLYGTGQIVAVADSGLDTGDMATLSPDFAGRLVATHVLSAGGDLGDWFGHGTHVAGSLAGAGVDSGADPAQHRYSGSFAGVAPEAGLVVQAFEATPRGAIIGLDPDFYNLFAQAYADGARLHSDSWGDPTGLITDTVESYGDYTYGSQRTDQFLWDHPDMSIFFAAGNSGKDGTPDTLGLFCTGGDGVIDPDSLLAPGTAKNVVTVGASESQRDSGGLSQIPWLLLDFCFATQPIATDVPSDNPYGMAAFSSRGPTDDGRAKPDIVAPGTNIVSNRSHYPGAGTLWGPYETNPDYVYSGGTSMATPLAAGAGVLVRQWLGLRGLANPSAAVVKAVLLDTTADMAPGQYGAGMTQEIPDSRPNNVAGWGRADLGFLTAPAPYMLWVDDHTAGLATGDVVSYTHTSTRPLRVLDGTQPLRVMLAWTDYPAEPRAARQLVNDLDLVVTGPGGATYYGNSIATGDRTNNVEGVIIDNPPAGEYSVQVRAFNVPMGPQPYALAVGGPVADIGQLTLTKTASPAAMVRPGELITYTLALDAGNRPITRTVTLSDALPLHTSFVGASGGGAPAGPGGTEVQWTIPALGANQEVTRTLTVRVDGGLADGTPIVNDAYHAGNGFDLPGIGPPVVVVVDNPAPPPPGTLVLTKTAGTGAMIAPGGLITYTLTVGASGGPVSGTVLSDTLPAHTAFVSASGLYSYSGATNNVVTWPLGGIAAGQSVTRTLTVRVALDTPAGTTISNASYGAGAADSAAVGGPPVDVPVRVLPRRPVVWLPLIVHG
ncbi:MAG: S8 family serine peptidase [Roseiflexaceae bacterium]